MTQPQNGGVNPENANPAVKGNADVQNDGAPEKENDIEKELASLKAEIETLKKESSGKDSKIAKLLIITYFNLTVNHNSINLPLKPLHPFN